MISFESFKKLYCNRDNTEIVVALIKVFEINVQSSAISINRAALND